MTSKLRTITKGATVAVLIVLASSGVVQLFFASSYAQMSPPLFSVTMMYGGGTLGPTGQYASIIANNMITLGIDAKLQAVDDYHKFYDRMFFENTTVGSPFDDGGYDMLFSGWIQLDSIPDFRSYFDPAFFPSASCVWQSGPCAPIAINYALYNSTQLNNLFDKLYTTPDTQTRLDLIHKWQEIVFNDSPYAYIYEPVRIVPRNPKWTAWGQKNLYSDATFPDIQHFSGGNSFTIASPLNYSTLGGTLNPAATYSSTNSHLILYLWIPITDTGTAVLDEDTRDHSLYPALGTNITSSPDGLDWTVQIRKGALFQSGVEITADDFVWTRWALTNPKTQTQFIATDIQNLGNVIDFTFLNGTTVTLDDRATPSEPVRHAWWKAVDRYTFEFHLSQPYAWTREFYLSNYEGFALPKHIMEKFPPETWDSQPFSTANGPYTYTWNVAHYGGTGSYTAVGPVGAGPYYMENFNFTTGIATLKKFHQYWNATGLEALGQFTVETYKIVYMPDKSTALDAFRNGQVDMLDFFKTAYDFTGSDIPTFEAMGMNPIRSPALAWTELGFNMQHPVFGTGVDTPLGKIDPSMASEAARHVRKAISHLIPRDQIVQELVGGAGIPLASFLGPGWGIWYNKDLKPDSYDNNTAAAELRAAGYTVGGISTLTPTQSTPFWLISGVVAVVGLTSSMVVVARKRKKQGSVTMKQMVSTGYADLEGLLHGGIPVGYAVLLISPPCDERDLLLRKMLKSNLSSGLQVFYVSGDIGRTQELVRSSPKGFYAFCPEAHRVASAEENLYEIPGVGNLVEFNILLNKGLSQRASEGRGKVIVMDLLSDLLFRHKALMTRKWLGEFIAKRKTQQFTVLCTLNPAVASKEEIGQIADLFDGIIEIFEKASEAGLKRFLAIRKMYGQDYSESELLLERSKLM